MGYSLPDFFDGLLKAESNCQAEFIEALRQAQGDSVLLNFIVFKNLLKELTTTMTTAFTGRLQFTGKKVGLTLPKGCFRLFTLDPGSKTHLLRCINKPSP